MDCAKIMIILIHCAFLLPQIAILLLIDADYAKNASEK